MTKKLREKKLFAGLLAVVMAAGMFAVGQCAFANQSYDTVRAHVSPQFTIVVDGSERDFYNADGKEVHPIVYEGTTYLPLRAIGELMDKNVNWDQSTLTVTLSGSRGGDVVAGVENNGAKEEDVSVQLRYDFTIVVDGIKRTFTDADGKTVYPMLYDGSTYLPLRAIGNLMNKTVGWDADTKTVTLSSAQEGSLVTDADSFYEGADTTGEINTQKPGNEKPTSVPSGVSPSTPIDSQALERAKNIALSHAGISASDAVFTKTKAERDKGVTVYEIEFIAGNSKYDYEIDAQTFEIRSYDKDITKNYQQGTAGGNQSNITSAKITAEQARQKALSHAGLSASDVNFRNNKLDYDDGLLVYEIEFIKGMQEYDYEINAVTGEVVAYDVDLKD